MLLTSKKFIAKLAALLLIINSLSFSQEHSSLISHWQIVPDEIVNGQLKDVNDKNNASFKGRLYKLSANSKNVVVLDGSENHFLITDDINKASLPQKEFSVSVIVNIKQYNNYSGIISAFQDNGSFEKGWLLAFENDHATFGLSTLDSDADGNGVMTYLNSAQRIELNEWHSITATYDGIKMKIYIDGVLDTESDAQKGKINYPDKLFFDIASYHDDNEKLLLNGSIYDLKLFSADLSEAEIKQSYESHKKLLGELPSLEQESLFLVSPYIQSVEKNSLRILFETKEKTLAVIQYGEKLPFENEIKSTSATDFHEIIIGNLKENTNYFYKVIVNTDLENFYSTDVFAFQTAFGGEQPVTIGIISDTQNNPAVIKNVTKKIYDERVNFVLHAGDIVGNGSNKFEWVSEYLNSASYLMARVPVFAVLGNHDEDAEYYYKYLSNQKDEYYFTFNYGVVQVFMIDSDRDLSKNSEQFKMIETDLQKSNSLWKIAVFHHPPYSSDEDDYGDTKIGKSVYGERELDDLVAMFEKYNLDVVINGHIHSYERTFPLRENKIDEKSGITYLVMGGAGGGLEKFAPTKTWFSSKIKSAHHYGIMQIYKTKLTLSVYDLNGNLFDYHIINKSQYK